MEYKIDDYRRRPSVKVELYLYKYDKNTGIYLGMLSSLLNFRGTENNFSLFVLHNMIQF